MGCCGGRSSPGRGRSRKFKRGEKQQKAKKFRLSKNVRDKHPSCPYMNTDIDCKDCDRRNHCPKYG